MSPREENHRSSVKNCDGINSTDNTNLVDGTDSTNHKGEDDTASKFNLAKDYVGAKYMQME